MRIRVCRRADAAASAIRNGCALFARAKHEPFGMNQPASELRGESVLIVEAVAVVQNGVERVKI